MVNAQALEGNWNEVKGQIKQRWGNLTDDDLASLEGSVDRVVGMIQRKTGESREAIENFLDGVAEKGGSAFSAAAGHAREYAQHAGEALREGYQNVAERVQGGYHSAEGLVRRNPARSVGLAFGAGLVTGVVVGLILRSR